MKISWKKIREIKARRTVVKWFDGFFFSRFVLNWWCPKVEPSMLWVGNTPLFQSTMIVGIIWSSKLNLVAASIPPDFIFHGRRYASISAWKCNRIRFLLYVYSHRPLLRGLDDQAPKHIPVLGINSVVPHYRDNSNMSNNSSMLGVGLNFCIMQQMSWYLAVIF